MKPDTYRDHLNDLQLENEALRAKIKEMETHGKHTETHSCDLKAFVKERDAAFIEFVQTGKTDKVRKHCRKYGIEMPKNRKVFAAGVYKAVIATTSIPEEIKTLAMQKCLEIGFNPLIAPYDMRGGNDE